MNDKTNQELTKNKPPLEQKKEVSQSANLSTNLYYSSK